MKRSATEESLEPSTSWKRKNSRRKGRSIEFFTEKQQKMSWLWLEAALPLGIIAGMLCVMGNAQYYIHRAAHGRVYLVLSYCYFPYFRSNYCVLFLNRSIAHNILAIFNSRSTSVTICGTWPWREGTRSSWRICPPLLPIKVFSLKFYPSISRHVMGVNHLLVFLFLLLSRVFA